MSRGEVGSGEPGVFELETGEVSALIYQGTTAVGFAKENYWYKVLNHP